MAEAFENRADKEPENRFQAIGHVFGIQSEHEDEYSTGMNHQTSFHQRKSYLAQKRRQVEEEVEHIISTVQEMIIAKKTHLLQKLDELYRRDQSLEETETASDSSKDIVNLERGFQDEREEDGHRNNVTDAKPALVDLNLTVDFEHLMNEVSDLSFGDINAVYDNKGSTVVRRYLNSTDSYEDCVEEVFTGRAVDMETMYTRVEGDSTEPKLNDIAVVELSSRSVAIVVTDRANNSVKSFYNKNNSRFFSYNKETCSPRGIAKIGGNKVAVTVPEFGAIRVLKVKPALKRDKLIKTSKGYRGIGALDPNTFVVSTYKVFPGTVDIIDSKGSLLKSFSVNQKGEHLFEYPFYLCTTAERNIIVSDCEQKHITCLTEDGIPIWILMYEVSSPVTLKYPLGVAVDPNGEVLVADCDNNNVIRMYESETAKILFGTEHGIMGPHGIDVDTQGTIYIAQWNGEIKIFSNKFGQLNAALTPD